MKIVSIVGARPQFIKAAALSRELRRHHREVLVHTGQHYDYEMSGIFFDGLGIPEPEVNLDVGSGPHGAQTGAMLTGIEAVLLSERPDWVVVYGDTNSTLAGALAAAKLHIPVAHVEAGLRSYNRRMPEEINRLVTDHLSDHLFCPSDTAARNLAAEGITANVHLVGDIMLDVLNWARQRLTTQPAKILQELGVTEKRYLLATVHRSENTDDPRRLAEVLAALDDLNETVIFPVHPRARKVMAKEGLRLSPRVKMIDPVGYLDMVSLTGTARLVLTDSGGLQKEAYWMAVPCITLRNETEWVETVDAGWNKLTGPDRDKIHQTAREFAPPAAHPQLYGDGLTAARCTEILGRQARSSGPSGSDGRSSVAPAAAVAKES